jgi:hypothetical protein
MVRLRHIWLIGMAGGFFVAGWVGGRAFGNYKAGGRGAGDVTPTGSPLAASRTGGTRDSGSATGMGETTSATDVAQAEATAMLNPGDQAWADAVGKLTKQLRPGLLVQWLAEQGDFEAAFALLDTHVPPEEYAGRFQSVFGQLADHDAGAAAEVYAKIEDPDLKAAAMQSLAMAWANQDVKAGFDWLAALNEGSAQVERAYLTLMERHVLHDPADAAEIVGMLEPGRIQAMLIPTVAAQLGRQDPQAALAWIDGLAKNGVATAEAVDEIFGGWASREPLAALNHALHSTSKPPGNATIGLMMDQLSREDPQQAAAMLDLLPDGARAPSAQAVARHWVPIDPQAAAQWIRQLPEEAGRDLALGEAARHLMEDHSAHAFEWAAAVGDRQLRLELIHETLMRSNLADTDSLMKSIDAANLAEGERLRLIDLLNRRRMQDQPATLILPH